MLYRVPISSGRAGMKNVSEPIDKSYVLISQDVLRRIATNNDGTAASRHVSPISSITSEKEKRETDITSRTDQESPRRAGGHEENGVVLKTG